jgi:hypothetical protein
VHAASPRLVKGPEVVIGDADYEGPADADRRRERQPVGATLIT